MKNKEQYQENRTKLKELSKMVKPLVEGGEYPTVNEAIKEAVIMEENPEIKQLNTFDQWKKKGFSVKKGEKAFLLWGRPRTVPQGEENDEFKFWPLCYIFSNLQVQTLKEKEVCNA